MLRARRAFRFGQLSRAASHFGAFVAGAAIATAALAHARTGDSDAAHRSRSEAVHTFAEALRHIDRYYVEPVDQEELVHEAIGAMMDTLDENSKFLAPRDYRRLHEDTDGRHSGVGLSLTSAEGALGPVIDRVIPASPAARAGLAPGDVIVAVGDLVAEGLDRAPRRFEHRLRGGPPGSRVELRVAGERGERTVELVREALTLPSVEWTVASAGDEVGVGIVAIERFHEGTGREVARALGGIARATGYPLRGVVLDLRGNPGGSLDAAIDVADLFLERGIIAKLRGRRGIVLSQWQARDVGTFSDVPLVVLIDRRSASAAEILAGSLQDHGRAVVAGGASYGKGSVQTLFDLPGGSGLRLTTSHYYTPADRAIGADGLTPDINLGELVADGAPPAGALAARWRDDESLVWAVDSLYTGGGELAVRAGSKEAHD